MVEKILYFLLFLSETFGIFFNLDLYMKKRLKEKKTQKKCNSFQSHIHICKPTHTQKKTKNKNKRTQCQEFGEYYTNGFFTFLGFCPIFCQWRSKDIFMTKTWLLLYKQKNKRK